MIAPNDVIEIVLLSTVMLVVSVFFHELGHYVAAESFGRKPRVRLIRAKGVIPDIAVQYERRVKNPVQETIILSAGPWLGLYALAGTSSVYLTYFMYRTTPAINMVVLIAVLVVVIVYARGCRDDFRQVKYLLRTEDGS